MAAFGSRSLPLCSCIALLLSICIGSLDIAAGADSARVQIDPAPKAKKEEAIVSHNTGEKVEVPRVLELNHFTFAGNVLADTSHAAKWIVVFCPTWWEPCKNLEVPFAAFARNWQRQLNLDLISLQVRFAKVDCATDKVLCNEQEVDSYPTVTHYAHGVKTAVWQGSGAEKDITRLDKWLNQQLGHVSNTTASESDAATVFSQYLIPGERATDVFLILAGLAASFWLVLSNPELWEKRGVPPPPRAEPTPPPAADTDSAVRRRPIAEVLPQEWAGSRGSVDL